MATLDSLVALTRKTILNPWLAIVVPVVTAFNDSNAVVLELRGNDGRFTTPTFKLSGAMIKALGFLAVCFLLRFHEYLTWRALNNGVTDRYHWPQEIVVVTGGAGGIGGELVQQLAASGAKIAVLDVMPLSYPKASNVEYFKCDLTEADSLSAAAAAIRKKWGHPTVLCAIAGIVRGKSLLDVSKRDLDLTFGVNTIALAMCYREFVPAMVKANHGHIVTMSSQTAYTTAANMADYAASKSAALALHEGLQTELKHIYRAPRVRCTVVLPSVVATKMFTGLVTPSQFLMPMLTPEGVATEIKNALLAGEARHIELPWLGRLLGPLSRASASYLRVALQDGASSAMKGFGGHKVMD